MKTINRLKFSLVLCLAAVLLAGGCEKRPGSQSQPAAAQEEKLPTVGIELEGEKFTVEIAFTEAQRLRGLGGRRRLPADEGMIFVFSRPRVRTFWMKDCYIDLDVIFIRQNLTIARITTMKTQAAGTELEKYSSGEPIKYALELPAGTAAGLKLAQDQKIALPDKITRIIADPD